MKHQPNLSLYPFSEFQPIYWYPGPRENENDNIPVCSVKRNHGIKSSYVLHNSNDEINYNRRLLDRTILEYRIGKNSYNLFTVGDFFESPYPIHARAEGNIMGDIAERISRRITKYFLQHFSPRGYTGGIFDKRFNPAERNDFIVANTDNYVLKIQQYPNLVILKRSGQGKFGYENIKELDGLFDYRYGKRRHILVLESKLDKINVNCEDLITNLFSPLQHFFPEASFSYLLFSDQNSIYTKKDFSRLRRIKHMPQKIHQTLNQQNIGTLFFTFNETYADFERIKNHLITQYRIIAHMKIVLHGKMVLSNREIALFDGGQTPHMKLVKNVNTGLWREVRLTHKRKN